MTTHSEPPVQDADGYVARFMMMGAGLRKPKRPVIGLDIDGVLLCQGNVYEDDIAAIKYSNFSSGVVRKETVAALALLAPLFDFRWFTSWDDDVATRVFEDIVDVHGSLLCDVPVFSGEDWCAIKTYAALKFAAEHPRQRVFLLDDEVLVGTVNLLTIPVDPRQGLTLEHAALIAQHL